MTRRFIFLTTLVASLLLGGVVIAGQASSPVSFKLQGVLTDFGTLRTDGRVNVGLMMPALRETALSEFDIMDLISSESDTISVLGQEFMIPSNVTLPEQRESYIFPITLDKPGYRMSVRQSGTTRLMAIHGQFPLKRVVDELRSGGSVFNILNQVNILETGVVDQQISGDMQDLNIPVNTVKFNQKIEAQAPVIEGDEVLIAIGFTFQDGYLMPSDVKTIESGKKLALGYPSTLGAPQTLSVVLKRLQKITRSPMPPLSWRDLMNINPTILYELFGKSPANVIDADLTMITLGVHPEPGVAPLMMNHIAPPVRIGQTLQFRPPNAKSGLLPLGTVVTWSRVDTVEQGKVSYERKTKLWEAANPSWVDQMAIPADVGHLKGAGSTVYRWDVTFLARDPRVSVLSGVTHATRGAVDE